MEMLARLRVGEWWADRATNELGRAGETLRIEPKVMEVLALLAARAGQVVSREELLPHMPAAITSAMFFPASAVLFRPPSICTR